MAMPPSARGRKNRLVRAGETPHDLLLVIRAAPADSEAAVDEMVELFEGQRRECSKLEVRCFRTRHTLGLQRLGRRMSERYR